MTIDSISLKKAQQMLEFEKHLAEYFRKGGKITELPYGMTKENMHEWKVNSSIIFQKKGKR
tara:strand:+ start:92 stop:274 length:183 start_codon:yes stop_codon:yes gene_type:complete